MSAPLDEMPRAQSTSPRWAKKLGGEFGPTERRRGMRRQADRDLVKSNRHLAIGNYILSTVLLLTVLAGLGMILKGCADFGSPFVTESGYLRTR